MSRLELSESQSVKSNVTSSFTTLTDTVCSRGEPVQYTTSVNSLPLYLQFRIYRCVRSVGKFLANEHTDGETNGQINDYVSVHLIQELKNEIPISNKSLEKYLKLYGLSQVRTRNNKEIYGRLYKKVTNK